MKQNRNRHLQPIANLIEYKKLNRCERCNFTTPVDPEFMRNSLSKLSFSWPAFIVSLLLITGCETTVKTDEAEIGEAIVNQNRVEATEVYAIDTTQSEVQWLGAKITGQHTGYLKLKEANLELHNGSLVSGRIVFDMKATYSEDKNLDDESRKRLTTHLLSADFFDVEKYPTAEFEITGVVPFDSTVQAKDNTSKYSALRIKSPTHRITGNLTIKDVKKSVTFPARITQANGELKARANFNIDRTKWGLIYRADEALGNQTIYPEVNLNLDILAKPASAVGTTVSK